MSYSTRPRRPSGSATLVALLALAAGGLLVLGVVLWPYVVAVLGPVLRVVALVALAVVGVPLLLVGFRRWRRRQG